MMEDVETVVKNNPGRSLLVAAVIGFLVGRAFAARFKDFVGEVVPGFHEQFQRNQGNADL